MAISINIDEGLKCRVQHLAAARQRSDHWIMREAIQSWVDYQQTG